MGQARSGLMLTPSATFGYLVASHALNFDFLAVEFDVRHVFFVGHFDFVGIWAAV